jgi:hypothetical protein
MQNFPGGKNEDADPDYDTLQSNMWWGTQYPVAGDIIFPIIVGMNLLDYRMLEC